MSNAFEYDNVSHALPDLAHQIMEDGHEVGSRLGERTKEFLFSQVTLRSPWRREILVPNRKASVLAQVAETMWVLAGRNDVEWLSHYLPRAVEFSDDGATWRGGYGPRIRGWKGLQEKVTEVGTKYEKTHYGAFHTDQLAHVVHLLTADHSTRRAVINIYDPAVDTKDGKDIPCNNWLSFISRDGYLHLNVATRSNDLIWGWSGINAFEWSALLEIVAVLVGAKVGQVTFNITSLHVYDRHWNRATAIGEYVPGQYFEENVQDSPAFHPENRSMGYMDWLIREWFRAEKELRTGKGYYVNGFPEPMLRSWLRVIAWYWTQDESVLEPLKGTRLYAAVRMSPEYSSRDSATRRLSREEYAPLYGAIESALKPGTDLSMLEPATVDIVPKLPPLFHKAAFIDYVDNLHREKGAAYGDSWKKRGEQMSILANIARKVDRLGGGGSTADETSADTAIDLLVYLIKYRLWLSDNHFGRAGGVFGAGMEEYGGLRHVLNHLDRSTVKQMQHAAIPLRVQAIQEFFAGLENVVNLDPHREHPKERVRIVESLILNAFPLARRLWEEENGHVAGDADRLDAISEGKTPTPAGVKPVVAVQKALDAANQQKRDVEKVKEVAEKLDHAARNATRRWQGYGEGDD